VISDEEIARALDAAGASDLGVAADLGCSPDTVARVRKKLGVPPLRRGRPVSLRTWEMAYRDRTVAVEDGHVRWCGRLAQSGTPIVVLRGKQQTAYRIAFRMKHRREPDGYVTPSCDSKGCVAGDHLEDRVMRQERRQGEAR